MTITRNNNNSNNDNNNYNDNNNNDENDNGYINDNDMFSYLAASSPTSLSSSQSSLGARSIINCFSHALSDVTCQLSRIF